MAKVIRARASAAPAETEPVTTTKRVGRVGRPKAEASTEVPKKSRKADGTVPSKFIGRTSGLRVMEFQDKLMKDNYKAKLTDAQLAELMRKEFPAAVPYTEGHVSGIRTAWNKGKRPSQGGASPARTLSEFDASGDVVPPRKRTPPPRRKKIAAAEEEEE